MKCVWGLAIIEKIKPELSHRFTECKGLCEEHGKKSINLHLTFYIQQGITHTTGVKYSGCRKTLKMEGGARRKIQISFHSIVHVLQLQLSINT